MTTRVAFGALAELDTVLARSRGLTLNEVLYAGVLVVDATGAATVHTAVDFASVAVRNYSSSLVTVAAAPPQGSPPAQGTGVTLLNAYRFAVVPLAGNVLTVYGPAGATVAVELYAQAQPPAGNATGGATFSPLQLPGLAIWLDASDLSTITGGASVSQWRDKSGGANHFNQGTVALQPASGTRTLNGRNVIDCRQPHYMTAANPMGAAAAGTAIIVYVLDAVTNSAIFDGFTAAGSYHPFGGTIFEAFGANPRQSYPVGSFADLAAHVYSVVAAANDFRAYLDKTTSLFTTAVNTTGFAAGTVTVGSNSSGTGMNGAIAEMIFCSGALSDADRNAAEAYLKTKWSTP